tara:strand:+ start:117 stop:392 length:276 start_codon:yes stop_codon:yes gene_type:complete
MTILEIMERAGIKETNLAIAYIKDAIHLIQSQGDDALATWKVNIEDGTRDYPFPANLIKLKSISVKDTNDDKWKKIKRLLSDPTVTEDNSP